MRYTIKAYNTKISDIPFMPERETDVVEIDVEAEDENLAIGKARLLTRNREYYDTIKIRKE